MSVCAWRLSKEAKPASLQLLSKFEWVLLEKDTIVAQNACAITGGSPCSENLSVGSHSHDLCHIGDDGHLHPAR
jgi:hypothetical protein